MCLRISFKKKYGIFFASLMSRKKGVGSGSVRRRYGSGSASKCHGSPTLLIGEYCPRRREEQGRLSPGLQPQYPLHRSQDCTHWGRGAQVSTELRRSFTLFREEFRVWIRSLTRICFLFYMSNILIVAFGLFFTK